MQIAPLRALVGLFADDYVWRMRKQFAVVAAVFSTVLAQPVSAAGCLTYTASDGSLFQFVASDPTGPDQAVLVRLAGQGSRMCIYTAEDEYGGKVLCTDLTDETTTPANDPKGIEAFGRDFALDCKATVDMGM